MMIVHKQELVSQSELDEKRFWEAYHQQKANNPHYSKCEACNGTGCGDGDNGMCVECHGRGYIRELP